MGIGLLTYFPHSPFPISPSPQKLTKIEAESPPATSGTIRHEADGSNTSCRQPDSVSVVTHTREAMAIAFIVRRDQF
ncbi:hypothetical protein [Mastigocladopsis repens]|uniref:hypothetical protein n=1 Tax=Mastigocladopsis repens TaxID=221287 RepID=UPI0012E9A501|nr:hypothetical protein [Mastigocladopsis repens]